MDRGDQPKNENFRLCYTTRLREELNSTDVLNPSLRHSQNTIIEKLRFGDLSEH